jgi:3-methyladenine DNA glycosylase AlkD
VLDSIHLLTLHVSSSITYQMWWYVVDITVQHLLYARHFRHGPYNLSRWASHHFTKEDP